MNFSISILVGILCFGLGYFIAQSNFGAEQQIVPSPQDITVEHLLETMQQKNQQAPEQPLVFQQQLKNQKTKINSVIDSATPEQIDQYLKQFFPEYDLSNIHNKPEFAKRLLDEFIESKNDPNAVLIGKVTVSAQQQYSVGNVLPRQIYAGQQLFAHFDTLGKVPNNDQVFIRWSNQSTGEVLFFMPQWVSVNQQQNWVSFNPAQGWEVGIYDVKYYLANDQLTAIAQTSFSIDQIID